MTLLVGLGVVLGSQSASAALSLPPPPSAAGFYSVPYSSTLYQFDDVYPWTLPAGVGTVWPASYETWQLYGFPAPRPAPTRYLKAPWSNTIFAVHEFVGAYGNGLVVHPLTFTEWQRAGYPTPEVTPRVPGAVYSGYSASPQIDVALPGEQHALTLSEWLASGSPAPKIVGWKPGAELVQYVSSAPDIFAVAADWSAHRLSYAEWVAWGFPGFRRTQVEGYYALA
ncbi:MAG: hypothetical protein B7X41_12160 [Microbacterium sp. 14-71-5]|nr:MAG: hypothetical protein B7X41_12160 [Microbacterium sp. 14-71-5]